MGFGDAIKHVFSNYVGFTGRAVRSEYWFFALFSVIIGVVLAVVDAQIFGASVSGGLWSLATFLPSLAVGVRRLHDTDRSGWFLLIALIPLIGVILLIVWLATQGTPGANRFGPPAPTSA